jgi:hypothetical protein
MEDEVVILYADTLPNGQPDPSRRAVKMRENEYISNFNDLGFNDWTSSIYVHPRMEVRFWNDKDKGGKMGGAAGRLDSGPIKDLSWMRQWGFDNSISSAETNPVMSQQDWVRACCRHETSDMVSQKLCGRYWGQGYSDCGNLGCTGDSLKTDTTCQNWCKNNPEYCDVIKSQFCREHSNDPYCGCINDTPAALAERTKYSKYSGLGTVPRKCWPSSPCNTGSDLVNSFITTELSPNIGCPTSLINQINEINAAQGATVIANQQQDATVTTNVTNSGTSGTGALDQANVGYTPKDTTQVYSQSSSGEQGGDMGQKKSYIWFYFLIFFVILIIICLAGWMLFAN